MFTKRNRLTKWAKHFAAANCKSMASKHHAHRALKAILQCVTNVTLSWYAAVEHYSWVYDQSWPYRVSGCGDGITIVCRSSEVGSHHGDVGSCLQRHSGRIKYFERYRIAHRARYKPRDSVLSSMTQRLYDHFHDIVGWRHHSKIWNRRTTVSSVPGRLTFHKWNKPFHCSNQHNRLTIHNCNSINIWGRSFDVLSTHQPFK